MTPPRSPVRGFACHPSATKRRRARHAAVAGMLAFAAAACIRSETTTGPNDEDPSPPTPPGRLTARVAAPTGSVTSGIQSIQVGSSGRFYGLFVPSTYDPAQEWPVVVMFHHFGSSGEAIALTFQEAAEEHGVVLVAPNSRAETWDLLLSGQFGDDVPFVNAVLREVFDHVRTDPDRVAIAGFSHGATYALWLGLRNGDLFHRVAALSACTPVPTARVGMPEIFVAHGTADTAAPIQNCSRQTVPDLRALGYEVEYVEHELGHLIPADVIGQATAWLTGTPD